MSSIKGKIEDAVKKIKKGAEDAGRVIEKGAVSVEREAKKEFDRKGGGKKNK